MTKTTIEIAIESGVGNWDSDFGVSIQRFAALVEQRQLERLTQGVEMPEPVAQLHPNHWKPNPDGSEWCREALLYSPNNEGDQLRGVNVRVKLYTADQLRDYAAAAVAKEREECATLVDAIEARCIELDCDDPALFNVAAAIRNRSKE